MSTTVVIALLLASSVLALWRLRRDPRRGWCKAALLALQPLCAVLLYCTLLPPLRPEHGIATLVVATAASDVRMAALVPGEQLIALPEAPTLSAAERLPDLATALRRHRDTQRLRIIGGGLPARDRDAVAGHALAYTPASPAAGLSELTTPQVLVPGADFQVAGRVLGLPQASVELLDPSARRVDHVKLDADGRFKLGASVRGAGEVLFELRVLAADGAVHSNTEVPVSVTAVAPARLWLLAAAPQPELKYLRRWAHDAGLAMHTQIALGAGLHLGDAARPLQAQMLDDSDVLILDERVLSGLRAEQRATLRAAVERGLGLLLRISSAPDAAAHSALADLGMELRGDARIMSLSLSGAHDPALAAARQGARSSGSQTAAADQQASVQLPRLQRLALTPASGNAIALLHASDGSAYAWWRVHGRGRIGVTTVVDSYRLVLEGDSERHAAMWSALLSPLARAHSQAQVQIPAVAWRGERITLCGIAEQAQLQAADGHVQTLLLDPGGSERSCAGYWPQQAGWHRLRQDTQTQAFYVRDPAKAPTLYAHTVRQATLALQRDVSATNTLPRARAGARWPWLLAFVLAASSLWWLERSRCGRTPDV